MLRLRPSQIADLTDNASPTSAQHTLDKGAASTIFHYKINTNAVGEFKNLLVPLWVRSVVDSLDLWLGELCFDALEFFIIRRCQDNLESGCLRQLQRER